MLSETEIIVIYTYLYLLQHGAGAIHYVFTDLYLHPPLDLLSKMVASGADVNLRDYVRTN